VEAHRRLVAPHQPLRAGTTDLCDHHGVQTSGLHHVSLGAKDVDASTTFYVDVLGGRLLPRPDFGFPGAWIEIGGGQVHLIPSDEAPAGANHFALQVADRDAAMAELRGKGVAVRASDHTPGAGRQAFLTDPSGNLIELNQPD
jgi:catechol 2,3-dioxygenase-like lactoylglutathione lyase family enzyme